MQSFNAIDPRVIAKLSEEEQALFPCHTLSYNPEGPQAQKGTTVCTKAFAQHVICLYTKG
jgi:hypothetical protein